MKENVTHVIMFGYDSATPAERECIDTEIRCDRVRWRVVERRLWLAAGIVFIIACLLSLTGCGGLPRMNTEVAPTTVKDTTPRERDLLKNLDLAGRDLVEAQIKLDQERQKAAIELSIAQAEIRRAESDKQAEIDRANAAESARQRNERTWMFVMIASGAMLLLGGGALAFLGFKTGVKNTVKSGAFAAMVGIAFILMAPNAQAFAKPILFTVYVLFGTVAVGAVLWMANNIYYEWLERKAKQ